NLRCQQEQRCFHSHPYRYCNRRQSHYLQRRSMETGFHPPLRRASDILELPARQVHCFASSDRTDQFYSSLISNRVEGNGRSKSLVLPLSGSKPILETES